MLSELNRDFGIKDRIEFTSGNGGLTQATLRDPLGNMVKLFLYGAHIASWVNRSFGEIFFMSPRSDFLIGKAIRGGIPLVFPQFGTGRLPSHGFARTSEWRVRSTNVSDSGAVSISMSLTDSPETRDIWPHRFTANIVVSLEDSLKTEFSVINSGETPFEFSNAFHTYFAVSSIDAVTVRGLQGTTYLDSLRNREAAIENRELITFSSQIDRIYQNAPDHLYIHDRPRKLQIEIIKQGLRDAVVWNPHAERCLQIPDLSPDGYRGFVCVEAGNVLPATPLPPGAAIQSAQLVNLSTS